MDGDLSDDRTDRGSDEDATDEYSLDDSDDSHEELHQLPDYSTLDCHKLKSEPLLQQQEPETFQSTQTPTLIQPSQSSAAVQGQVSLQNQDTEFTYRIQQNPQLQADQAAFTAPYEKLTSEAFAQSGFESTDAQQQYEQHIQEDSRHQQVGLHVTSLPGQAPLSRSSTYLHDPQPLMSAVALKSPSQMPSIDTAIESVRMTPQMIQTEEQPSAFMPPSQLPANMLGQVPLQYQGTDLMHRIPLNPQLQTDFTLPEEVPSPQAAVDRITPPVVAQQQYQQLSSQQQLQPHFPKYIYFPTPQGYSLIPMYSSFALITHPQQPSSQMTPGHLPAQRNPEEIKKIEDELQSFHIVKTLRPELGSKLDGVLENARLDSSVGENTSDKTSKDDYYNSDEEFNVVEEDNDPTNSFNSALSGKFMSKANQQTLQGSSGPSFNNDPIHNAPCSSYTVTSDTDMQSPNQVEEDNDLTQTFSSQLPSQCMANTNQQTLPTGLPRRQDPSPDVPSTSGMRTYVTDSQSPNKSPIRRPLTQENKSEVMQDLAQKLKNRRQELNRTQKEVADELNNICRKCNVSANLSQMSISYLERASSSLHNMYYYKTPLELWLKYNNIKNPKTLVNKPVYTSQRCQNTNSIPKNSREVLERSSQRNPNKSINTTINYLKPNTSSAISPVTWAVTAPITRPDSMHATSSPNTPDSIFRAMDSNAVIAGTDTQGLGKILQQNLKPDVRHTGMLPKPIPMNKKVMMARLKMHHQLETTINLRTASSIPPSPPVTTAVTSPMVYVAPRSVVTAPGNSSNLSDIPTFTDNDEEDIS